MLLQRDLLVLQDLMENKVFVVAANKVGPLVPEDMIEGISAATGIPLEFLCGAGESQVVAPDGTVLAKASPDRAEGDFHAHLNPDSLRVVAQAWIEPSLAAALPEEGFQFEREGYFVADRYDHTHERPVFNRTIGLRDTWSEKGEAGA